MSVKLVEHECPNCGAALQFRDDQVIVTCRYCGAKVERKLDRRTHDKLSAEVNFARVSQYKKDMQTLDKLRKNRETAKSRVKLCSQNTLVEPNFLESCPYFVLIPAALLSVFIFLVSKAEMSAMILMFLIIAVSVIVMLVNMSRANAKRALAAEAKSRIDEAQKELVKAGDELEAFEKRFNIDLIPEQFRSYKALDKMLEAFETGQAATMGEAYKLCEEMFGQMRLEEMQREHIARVSMLAGAIALENAAQQMHRYGSNPLSGESLTGGASPKTTAELMMAIARTSAKGGKNGRRF